jgi:dTDP-4-dehydrorhamnose 3,5-epimerase
MGLSGPLRIAGAAVVASAAMTEPVRDRQTVTPAGERLARLPHGMQVRDLVPHVDDRGSVIELFDPRWGWHPDPLVFAYSFTLRPGYIKGWNLHREHEDRYALLAGEMELVVYDERPDSPTQGLVASVVITEYRRQLVNVPAGVWHADRNIGSKDVVVINFPSRPYDHGNPDKYRLPLDSERIPYRFRDPRGG